MDALRSVPIGDLVRQVVEDVEGASDQLREYRVTVTNGRTHVRYTTKAKSWHCAWMEAVEQYGIPSVVTVHPIYHDQPEEAPQLCLV